MTKLRTTLIGAGSIGGFKPDHVENVGTGVLSHGHAINRFCTPHEVIDIEAEKRNYVKNKWRFSYALRSLEDSDFSSDLYVIATPPDTHLDIVKHLTRRIRGKTVLIEKPYGMTAKEAYKMTDRLNNAGCKVFVNYQRNYLPMYSKITLNEHIGDIQEVVLHYCRGYKRDASHFFALLSKWGIETSDIVFTRNGYDDFSLNDQTVSAMEMSFPGVHLVAHDGRHADVFQVEVFGTTGRAIYEDHGKYLALYTYAKENTFGDYNSWQSTPVVVVPTGLEDGLSFVYRMILGGDSHGFVDGELATEIHEAMENI